MAEITIDKTKRGTTDDVFHLESDFVAMHPLVSWRSVVAGLLVSLLCLAVLSSLGLAFGGISLMNNDTTAARAGVATGVWFLISALISLFAGSYFAARISKFHTNRIGSAQGVVIASLFFGLFLWQTMSAIGWAGRMAGSAVGGAANMVGQGASQASQSPMVRNIVENAVGDLNLKSSPETVISGVASRLIQGDREGAKNYLARQAGITPAEADRRIAQVNTQIQNAMNQAAESGAKAMQGAGWSLFFTLVLGTAAAIGGGALGSRANLRKPLTREQVEAISGFRPATV
jgi:hypothetical protein